LKIFALLFPFLIRSHPLDNEPKEKLRKKD